MLLICHLFLVNEDLRGSESESLHLICMIFLKKPEMPLKEEWILAHWKSCKEISLLTSK